VSAAVIESAARSWTLPVMLGRTLSANGRPHWRYRQAVTREWRTLAEAETRNASVPRLERAHITVEWLPPDRGRRDPNNVGPMSKAITDGIVDAGVLVDDDAEHLDGPDHRLGEIVPRRNRLLEQNTTRLRVTIQALPYRPKGSP
jgi:hypothetical protein